MNRYEIRIVLNEDDYIIEKTYNDINTAKSMFNFYKMHAKFYNNYVAIYDNKEKREIMKTID